MARDIIYASFDFQVTREDGIVTIAQRNRGAWLFGVAACLLAMLGWWARSLLASASVHAMLLHWCSVIMAICGVVLLLSAAFFSLRQRGSRFDPRRGIATLRGRDYPMHELTAPTLTRATLGGTCVQTLTTRNAGKEFALLSSTTEGALDPVHQALNEAFAACGETSNEGAIEPVRGSAASRRFLAMFLLLIGALWAGVGYLTLPDVLLGPRGHEGGALMWPLGLWLMALGLLELAYGLRGRSFFDGNPRIVRITLAAALISYLLVCWR